MLEGTRHMKLMKVRLTFLEPVLGMSAADPEIHEHYIASKAGDAPKIEEEVAAIGVDGVVERGMTIFPKLEDGTPFMWDYQVKGFFKDACGMLRRVTGSKSAAQRSYKKVIDGLIFPQPRKIPFVLPEDGEITTLQRPLRASTPQGERITLANSEMIPAGTKMTFVIEIWQDDLKPFIEECLTYGSRRGMGQWRNASFGRFRWEELDKNGKVIGGNLDSD